MSNAKTQNNRKKRSKHGILSSKPILLIVIGLCVAMFIVFMATLIIHENNAIDSTDDSERTISLTGITSTGVSIINATGKYDDFMLDDNGVPVAETYDDMITGKDAELLEKREQMPNNEGIFAYNKNISLQSNNANDNNNKSAENENKNTN